MSERIFRSIFATALLAVALALLAEACTSSTSAQSGTSKDPIEGLWNSQVTITNCQTGVVMRQFQAMNLFIEGGTLVDTDVQPATAHGPAFGTWKTLGGGGYASVFQFFRYNPDGSYAGANRVTRNISISADGNAFTSTLSIDVNGPSGTALSTACGMENASRA
ncbi:MAG TPA: hypothetical protein VIL19_07290 [Casimicrobiaceae bacterium]